MKKFTLLFAVLFAAFYSNAQNVAINNDGTVATSSAMLDVKSTTKGFMMPRVTSAQRTTIASPALGLLVFDTDTKTIWAYNGSAWTNLSSAGGGGFVLPYENSAAIAGTAFKITNTGTAIEGITTGVSSNGIRGTATANGSNGVMGISTAANGVGVRGESTTGTGMIGYSTSGTGLNASSISGTGIYANSISGTAINASSSSGIALNVNGNLKISGGNTNPSNGAVLTSDADGNAKWTAQQKVAFRARGVNATYALDLATNVWYKVIFPAESYDFSNNFSSYSGSSAPVDASTFIVPVRGVYNFDVHLGVAINGADYSDPDELVDARIRLAVTRNGVTSYLDEAEFYTGYLIESSFDQSLLEMKISGDFYLLPGDKVFLQVLQYNANAAHAFIIQSDYLRFSGRLVIPD